MNLKNESELGYTQISFTDQEAFTNNTWKLHVNCARQYVWKLEVYLMARFFHKLWKTSLNTYLVNVFN